eukprot:m.233291 g.233291  ORF g.233291 m.233291 type:complete len:477 (+) comp26504_c2_seq1:1192-2622(+)
MILKRQQAPFVSIESAQPPSTEAPSTPQSFPSQEELDSLEKLIQQHETAILAAQKLVAGENLENGDFDSFELLREEQQVVPNSAGDGGGDFGSFEPVTLGAEAEAEAERSSSAVPLPSPSPAVFSKTDEEVHDPTLNHSDEPAQSSAAVNSVADASNVDANIEPTTSECPNHVTSETLATLGLPANLRLGDNVDMNSLAELLNNDPSLDISAILNSLKSLPVFGSQPKVACGAPVDTSPVDHFPGVQQRQHVEQLVEHDVFTGLRSTPFVSLDTSRFAQEEALLLKHAKERGEDAAFYNDVGQLFRVRGNTTLAIECFRKALLLNPFEQSTLLNLAHLLVRLKFYRDAEDIILFSHSQHPPNYQSNFVLGEALLFQERLDEALGAFEECIQLHPKHHLAEVRMSEIRAVSKQRILRQHYVSTTLLICFCVVVSLVAVYFSISGTQPSVQVDDISVIGAGDDAKYSGRRVPRRKRAV